MKPNATRRHHLILRAARKGSLYGRLDGHGPATPYSADNYLWLSDLFTGDGATDSDIKLVYAAAYHKAHDRAQAQAAA